MQEERKWSYVSELLEKTPEEIKGWEEMYPYYHTFRKEYAKEADKPFWFIDQMHVPIGLPLTPFETLTTSDGWNVFFSGAAERLFKFPTTRGNDYKILWGYIYNGSLYVTDPKEIEERSKIFKERLDKVFKHWDEFYSKWEQEMMEVIREIEKIEFEDLPETEPDEHFPFESSGFKLLDGYHRLLSLWYKVWRLHFYPFLNISYLAQLMFYDFMKKQFPGISDETILKMLRGAEPLLFRPEVEIRKLAYLAKELGITDILKEEVKPEEILEKLKKSDAGRKWLEEFDKVKYPWFYINTAPHPGLYSTWRFPSWIHDLSIPFSLIRTYILKLERGERVERPLEEIAKERERLVAEYRALLPTDEDKKRFDELYTIARKAFTTFTENHVWYVECWAFGLLYDKLRKIAEILAKHGFFKEWKDVLFLTRYELAEAIYDLVIHWAAGVKPVGPYYWPPIIEKRKRIWENMKKIVPPIILNKPPEKVLDPVWLMLWGITDDRVKEWTGELAMPIRVRELRGHPASPGISEGPARVVLSPDELYKVKEGDILVCGATSPAWVSVFPRIKGVVTDGGGIMSHAAIVAREYGIPAVVGTGYATKIIKDNDRLRVDGSKGIVSIL